MRFVFSFNNDSQALDVEFHSKISILIGALGTELIELNKSVK
jgi:hypothetical protein